MNKVLSMSSTTSRTNQEINSHGCKIINASQVLSNTLMNENRHHTSARKIKKKNYYVPCKQVCCGAVNTCHNSLKN